MEKVELFAEETLKDRGQMSREEYDAFLAMLRLRDSAPNSNAPDSEVFEQSRTLYNKSGFDFQGHAPMGFGWKTLWVAVRTTDIIDLTGTLASSFIVEQKQCSVDETYYSARPSAAFKNMTQDKFFLVTQPCDGTIFIQPQGGMRSVIWDGFLEARRKRHLASLALQTPCSEISKTIGDCYFFWSNRVTRNHGFMLWRQGVLARTVSTLCGEGDVTIGDALVGEVYHENYADDEWGDTPILSEYSLFETARRWKVNPNHINPVRPGEKAYCWFVDARDWQ